MSSPAWPGQEVGPAPAPASGGVRPVFTAPDPKAPLDAEAKTVGIEGTRTNIADTAHDNARQGSQDAFGNADTLKGRYESLTPIKEYRAVLPVLMDALQTPSDATGDNALIYAYAKAMDPGSVVRESEMGMAASGASVWDSKVAALKKQLGIEGGGQLPPEIRTRLKQQINSRVAQMVQIYNGQRQRFAADAKAYGIDPERVIGPHDAAPILDRYRALSAPLYGHVNPADMRGGFAKGTDVQMGGGDDSPFDRATFLKEHWGVTEDQEQLLKGMWQSNSGNQNLTAEQVAAFYAQNGIPAPDMASLVGEVEKAKKLQPGTQWGGFDTSQAEAEYRAKLQKGLDQQGFDPSSMDGLGNKIGMGASQGLADELSGVGAGIDALVNNQPVIDAYRTGRDQTRMSYEQSGEKWPVLGTIGEIAGGVLTGAPFAGEATVAGAARAGAGIGAISGFGYGEGAQDSLGGAALGAGMGAALGAGGQKFMDARAARGVDYEVAAATPSPASTYASAQKYGLDISLGDAGGMSAKAAERVLDVQPGAASLMNTPRKALGGQIDEAVADVANTFGDPTSFRGIGEAAQEGVKGWRSRFEGAAEKVYNAIPIKPETPAAINSTVGALQELTNKITSNPKLAEMLTDKRLVGYLGALEGGLSWNDLKQLRSRIGEEIGEQVLGEGTLKSDLRRLYGALSDDMAATAQAQGPQAFRAFERANTMYREGQERLDRVWTRLLGPDGQRTPEAAASFIQRIAKEGKGTADLAQIAELRKTLKPDEWGRISNGLISLLGQPANSTGREFAAQTFFRNFVDMDDTAKNLLFGGQNKPLRQNLDEFANVIGKIGENDGTRNVSQTGMALSGALGYGAGGVAGLAAQTLLSFSAAKLWTDPRFVRWATGYSKMLRGAAKSGEINPKAQQSQMGALLRLAANDNVIALEATGLAKELSGVFAPGQVAANGGPRLEGGETARTPGAPQ